VLVPLEEVKAPALLMEVVAWVPLEEDEAPTPLVEEEAPALLEFLETALLASRVWSLVEEEEPALLQVPAAPDPLALLASLGWSPLEVIEVPASRLMC
jgi:hypothetical protein